MAITTESIDPRSIVSTDISKETHEALKRIARTNRRSVAGELRYMIDKHVAEHLREEVQDGA